MCADAQACLANDDFKCLLRLRIENALRVAPAETRLTVYRRRRVRVQSGASVMLADKGPFEYFFS